SSSAQRHSTIEIGKAPLSSEWKVAHWLRHEIYWPHLSDRPSAHQKHQKPLLSIVRLHGKYSDVSSSGSIHFRHNSQNSYDPQLPDAMIASPSASTHNRHQTYDWPSQKPQIHSSQI